MSLCSVNHCEFYTYPNSTKCSYHNNIRSDSKITIKSDDLYKLYDNMVIDIITSEKEESNIMNLIKNTKEKNIIRVLNLVILYLKSIKKKYISSSLCLKMYNYLDNNIKNVHYLYWLVRDYWNINKEHPETALCYYNSERESDIQFYRLDKISLPRLPISYNNFIKLPENIINNLLLIS